MRLRNGGVLLALVGALSGAAGALPPARVELEGVAPLPTEGLPLRTAALRDGLARAVERVARDLVAGAGRDLGETDVGALLGGDARDYARRYRVVADLGERESTAADGSNDGPKGRSLEYALALEVYVDVDRVAEALRAAGWLEALPGQLPTEAHEVVVEAEDWGAYTAFLRLLRERGGARSAVPEVFSAATVRLRVEAPGRAEELLDRLTAAPSDGLRVEALEPIGRAIHVRARHLASDGGAPKAAASSSIDTESPNRY